jgi:hypothetical protein
VDTRQFVGLLFFPFGVALGLLIAWWKEGLGGVMAVASLAGFYLVYGALLTGQVPRGPWLILFTMPAVLFLGAWLLASRAERGKEGRVTVRFTGPWPPSVSVFAGGRGGRT